MSTTAATRSSLMLASAISRDPALQVCPALQKMPQATAVAAACSSLTSPSTTWADLPPHSSATCLALDSAAQPRNRRPTSADRRVAKRAIDEELMPHPRPGDQGGPQYYRASPIGPSPFSCAFSQLCLHSAGASTGRPPARRFPRRGPALPAGKRTRPGPPAPARPGEVTPPLGPARRGIRELDLRAAAAPRRDIQVRHQAQAVGPGVRGEPAVAELRYLGNGPGAEHPDRQHDIGLVDIQRP